MKKMQGVPERTALVTGSSSGIGAAIVKRLAELDYKLVVTGRSEKDIELVANECVALSPSRKRPLEVRAELECESERERLIGLAMAHFNGRLNLLVNNAGLGQPVDHNKADECYSAYKRVMSINLDAAIHLILLAAPALKRAALDLKELKEWPSARHPGATSSVINVSSICAFRPTESLFAYGTSKAALNSASESMACELAPLVRVNTISPGPVETKIIERAGFSLSDFKRCSASILPLGRIGHPDEVAEAVLYLADPERAAFVTGANLIIDGGALRAPLRWSAAMK